MVGGGSMSLPSPGAWIETLDKESKASASWESLPSPGAWIETWKWDASDGVYAVAPFTGSVD